MPYSLIFTYLSLLALAVAVVSPRATSADEGPRDKNDFEIFRPSEHSPIDLLDILRNHERPVLIMLGTPAGWITREHVAELMDMIDSDEPCAGVKHMFASRSSGRSTVGHEARVLIDGYRQGRYPNFLHSEHVRVTSEELRKWWEAEQED